MINAGASRSDRRIVRPSSTLTIIQMPHQVSFTATIFKIPGKGGWHFVPVPAGKSPPVTHGWGRTPVVATVHDVTWDTSVWWDSKSRRTLLAIPKKARGEKGHGDRVKVTLLFKAL